MGRPPLDVDELRVKIIYEAPKGLGDEKLAEFLGISSATYYNLKANNSEFLETIKFYKKVGALDVLKSFTKIACGFSYDESVKELKRNKQTGKMELITTKVTTKHVVPSASAGYNYLKNQMPEYFKDKIEAEHTFTGALDHITFVIQGKK